VDEKTLIILVAVIAVPALVFFTWLWSKRKRAWTAALVELAKKYGLQHTPSPTQTAWDWLRGKLPEGTTLKMQCEMNRTALSGADRRVASIELSGDFSGQLMVTPKPFAQASRYAQLLMAPITPSGNQALDARSEIRGAGGTELARLNQPETVTALLAHLDASGFVVGGQLIVEPPRPFDTAEPYLAHVEAMRKLERLLSGKRS